MSGNPEPIGMSAWTRTAAVEPVVRIGIVLEEDALQNIELVIGRDPCDITTSDAVQHLAPGMSLTVSRHASGLDLHVGVSRARSTERVRIGPREKVATVPGGGVLVRGVVAGRGFHWQKHIDVTLAGTLELRQGLRGLVLVNELSLEDYLAGVITAEMSGACPADLLKAQCVVARSWLLAMTEPKHRAAPFDRCNDDCCQRYQGTGELSPAALEAVRKTRGEVLLNPAGNVLDANYSKSCGGISETPVAVWGLEKPGISAIVDAPPDAPERRFFPITDENLDEYLDGAWLAETRCYCSPNAVPADQIGRYLGRVDTVDEYFRWTVRYTRAELEALLRAKMTDGRELAELRDLRVRARGGSGRAYIVEVDYVDKQGHAAKARLESEYRIRQVLHRKFLYSSAFAVRPERDAQGRLVAVTLRGAGWGHGVGLCQIGALGMALCGKRYEEICRHYYPLATLATVYT